MNRWRRLILRYRPVAAALLLVALCVRLLVPAGFMPVASATGVTLQICPGYPPVPARAAGMHHHGDRDHGGAKSEMPCSFAGLAMPTLGGADPLLLALAIAFVFVFALRPVRASAVVRRAHLRPPLRGPPITT